VNLPHRGILRACLGPRRHARLALAAAVAQALSMAPAQAAVAQAELLSHRRTDAIHERWQGNSDGLPDSVVEALIQDRRGFLWLGTPQGVFRFDGHSFMPVASQAQIGGVLDLCLDVDGSVWAGTYSSGLFRLAPDGAVSKFADIPGLADLECRRLLVDRSGRLWIGTDFGLWMRDAEGFREVGLATKAVHDLALGPDGRVWIAADRLYVSDGTAGREPSLVDLGLRTTIIAPRSLAWSADGLHLWIGGLRGLTCVDAAELEGLSGTRRVYTSADGLGSDWPVRICLDAKGRPWVATANSGISCRGAEDRFQALTLTEGLSDDVVHDLLFDREGSLWVATDSGLDRFRPRSVATLAKTEGLRSRQVWGVVDDGRGGILTLTHAAGVARIDRSRPRPRFDYIDFPQSQASGAWAGIRRRDGSVWIGLDSNELYEWGLDGEWRALAEVAPPLAPLSGFCEDAQGNTWFSSQGLVGRWDGARTQLYAIDEGGGPSNLWSVLADSRGEVFVAGKHLYRKVGEDFEIDWTPPAHSAGVFALSEDSGNLWIGLIQQGLCVRREGRVQRFVGPGMPTGDVYGIVRDREGLLWLPSSSGLWRVDPRELLALAEASAGPTVEGQNHVRRFDKLDGLDSLEFNGGGQSAGVCTPDGRLWFANSAGVVVVDPARLAENALAPVVSIERAIHNESELRLSDPRAHPVGAGRVEIHYSAASLLLPARVRFEYQLEGVDPGWVDAGGRRFAFYTGLRGGDYRFRVRARNEDGVASESDAVWQFSLEPRFTSTPAFFALCALGAAGMLLGLHRLRVRSLLSRELELASMVDRRTIELRAQVAERQRVERELVASNDLLEERVRERTRETSQVSERLQRENAERLRAESARRDGELRLSAIVAQLPGVIWTTDRELLVDSMQGGLLGARGRSPLARRSMFVGEFAQEGADGPATLAHRAALAGTPSSFEVTLYTRSLRCSVQPLRDASGNITGTIGLALDVTEERRLELQLAQAQKLDSLGRLAGGVAHDLNNLLTVILCHAESVELSTGEERTRRETAQVRAASERAAELTRQLLAFARRQVVEPRVMNLGSVLLGMESLLRRVISEDIELSLEVSPELGHVNADRSQIEQVLVNLVVNARDAMPGGGRLRITTRNRDFGRERVEKPAVLGEHEYVELAVIDNGSGMSDSVRARIFEPFFTTKAPGQGTGLGLATCYGIVQQCGGHIEVESRLGRGTTFRVLLPRTRAASVGNAASQDLAPAPRGDETLLLVEDEPEVRAVARAMLEPLGYRLLEASSGIEALEVAAAHEGRLDLLLSDLVMPRMGGAELATRLMALRPQLRVLFMSGYVGDDAALHDKALAGVEVVAKPFTARTLARRVRETLDRAYAAG